ncbi:MAG TPA: AzlD domain-containing protein [Spongiibacteraceae bacterium]|nr:AzlD domain-containing protein [Spongiibacteraceae bacterium]
MTNFSIWLAIVGLTVMTAMSRSLFLLAGTRVKIPHNVQRALRYAPAAALVALIAPEILSVDHTLSMAALQPAQNPKLLAAIFSGVLFFYTRHMLLMIVTGMALFTLLRGHFW